MANEKATALRLLFYPPTPQKKLNKAQNCLLCGLMHCLAGKKSTGCLVIGQVFKNCTRMTNVSV